MSSQSFSWLLLSESSRGEKNSKGKRRAILQHQLSRRQDKHDDEWQSNDVMTVVVLLKGALSLVTVSPNMLLGRRGQVDAKDLQPVVL
jgi:hypothetical protein